MAGDEHAQLRSETEKWLGRLEQTIPGIKANTKMQKEALKNIKAYAEDSRYFFSRDDLVRSFEACIWAWAWYDIMFKFNSR